VCVDAEVLDGDDDGHGDDDPFRSLSLTRFVTYSALQ
jgi:hypothetical protein